ncbi:MAG TPA: type II toxin-antitoxin system VapC family toxin [Stellaceae bacterium]
MRILADTHIFVWCDQTPKSVSPTLLAVLRDTGNEVFVSAASVWEIAIKRALGKLSFPAPIANTVQRLGFELLPITAEHGEHAGGLPRHHRDPFDRLIIAQAALEGLVLATQDPRIRPYNVATLGLESRD